MSLSKNTVGRKKIQCRKCEYYQITWDTINPYGCSKFGFKTTLHPADYILKVSGQYCQSFLQKKFARHYSQGLQLFSLPKPQLQR